MRPSDMRPYDYLLLNWLKVPGNYHRYVKADARKRRTGERRMDIVAEICEILAGQGFPVVSQGTVLQRLNDWVRWYTWAREKALDGKAPEIVKDTFLYYYDLVDYIETKSNDDNNNNNSTTNQPMTGGPSHASRIRQPIVISSSAAASDISDACSHDDDDDGQSLESFDEDHQPTDIVEISPLHQQQHLATTTMKSVNSNISYDNQREDAMEVVEGSEPTLANTQQQRHDILQQQQQQHPPNRQHTSTPYESQPQQQQVSSSYQDLMEMQSRQKEMMERLIQQQQRQTLKDQARRDRIKQLQLRLSLLDRMKKAGSSKDEIAAHINQLQ